MHVKARCWSHGGIGGDGISWKGWREKRGYSWWWDVTVCLSLIWPDSQHCMVFVSLSPVLCLIQSERGWIRRSSKITGRVFFYFLLVYVLPKLTWTTAWLYEGPCRQTWQGGEKQCRACLTQFGCLKSIHCIRASQKLSFIFLRRHLL